MTKKQEIDRRKAVLAMEYLARHINDEEVFMGWLALGVADGDIPYGTLDDLDAVDDYYIEDDNFRHLMRVFVAHMIDSIDSGLYCGGILS